MPKSTAVRPISARIRQSLFDILRPRVPGSRFLDLFAGTGAVGLEALSRGAEAAVFVDMDPRCIGVIEKNIARAGWTRRGKVFRANLIGPLSWISYRARIDRFDLIFMGPPYKDSEKRPLQLTNRALSHAASSALLAPDGWIICQHHKKEAVSAPAGLERFRTSRYGDTTVSFFRRAGASRSEISSC